MWGMCDPGVNPGRRFRITDMETLTKTLQTLALVLLVAARLTSADADPSRPKRECSEVAQVG